MSMLTPASRSSDENEHPWCAASTAASNASSVTSGTLAVVGVVSWSTGPALSDGCGGLTGVTPLTRYRAWIVEQAGKMGARLSP